MCTAKVKCMYNGDYQTNRGCDDYKSDYEFQIFPPTISQE